ncbi:MAG: 23S rRNA (pseudouridine(1915)-N(3))-methyltransferase RlmH [Thermoanaerobaculia bacterium]|nr:23S rRNA (pseudouridine(1915)-N(3))-methyltransferase RlmH [Thermoanaerobaculia bacterium]
MKLRLIWVGRISDRSCSRLVETYLGRVRQYFPAEITVVSPEKARSRSDEEIIAIESSRLVDALPARGKVVVLDERGGQMSSVAFGTWLERETVHNPYGVSFVMGGDLGLDDGIRSRADRVLALSQMTLPHELARVVLLEQIYRACTLIRNVRYHK